MFPEFVAAGLGAGTGILAGLMPGLHTNLLAVVVAGLHADAWLSSVFLVSLAVSRSVSDSVPTVFLGASEDVMSLLPGHQLLKKGFGVEAVKCSVLGSILGVIGGIALLPVLVFVFPALYAYIRPYVFWLLAVCILLLLLRDKWWAWLVFTLSGLLGVLALDAVREPLFPLLSGFFGASGLLLSVFNKVVVPEQHDADMLRVKAFLPALLGIVAGSILIMFPGLGPSQAAALAQFKKLKSARFLVLTGSLGTVDVIMSLAVLYALNKARNGAVVIVEQLLGSITAQALAMFVAAALFAAGASAIIVLLSSKWYGVFVSGMNYALLSLCVFSFLCAMSFFLSGLLGVLIFATATAIGLIAPLSNCSRAHAMGCLLVPTLILLW
ncbi:MAG: tripartite tricarboxylate transporter permease [Candidatus Woesearchaeota archaeon]